MRSVFIVVVMLIVSIFLFSCEKEIPTNIENTQNVPDIQMGTKKSDDVTAMSSGVGMSYKLADHYLVEFSGSVDELSIAVSLLEGSVDNVFKEISIAKVSGLDDAKAKSLSKVKGVKSVARDILVQWIDPNAKVVEEHIGENESFWGINGVRLPYLHRKPGMQDIQGLASA